jgi:hypothetical protein
VKGLLEPKPKHSSTNHTGKKEYLQFLQTKTGADQIEYKSIRATVRREKIRINRWDTYISNTEHDVHG